MASLTEQELREGDAPVSLSKLKTQFTTRKMTASLQRKPTNARLLNAYPTFAEEKLGLTGVSPKTILSPSSAATFSPNIPAKSPRKESPNQKTQTDKNNLMLEEDSEWNLSQASCPFEMSGDENEDPGSLAQQEYLAKAKMEALKLEVAANKAQ